MKHPLKLTLVLITMFFIAQLIGIAVIHNYSPEIKQVVLPQNQTNQTLNVSVYNLPFGMNPPEGTTPSSSLLSMVIAIAIGVVLILTLMKIRAEVFIRLWFFVVITIALGIAINSFIQKIPYSALIALIVSLPFAIIKVFKKNIFVHNITELLIYPGIAAIIVPLLNVWTVVVFLILISVYDIYAVWHAGFMQKMAKYQMNDVKVFGGFLVPYIGKEDRALMAKLKKLKDKSKAKLKKIKVNVAILGGGDVIFPIITAGVVLNQFGFLSALIIALGATLALAALFYYSEKGRFYPAMPFISAGCFIALGVVYLLQFFLAA
jgi:presenilin-like A22 family membrane protease